MVFIDNLEKEEIFWTKHAEEKMRQYQLSKSRVLKVLRNPKRVEEGVVPGTTALMQTAGSKKHPYEIWLMYEKDKKIKIIAAWRYPGISPLREPIPLPKEIAQELFIDKKS